MNHPFDIRPERLRILQTARIAYDLEHTRGMYEAITGAIDRFLAHDWGNASESSKEMNNESLASGDEILGVYPLSDKLDIWLYLDPASGPKSERVLTIMYPDEY